MQITQTSIILALAISATMVAAAPVTPKVPFKKLTAPEQRAHDGSRRGFPTDPHNVAGSDSDHTGSTSSGGQYRPPSVDSRLVNPDPTNRDSSPESSGGSVDSRPVDPGHVSQLSSTRHTSRDSSPGRSDSVSSFYSGGTPRRDTERSSTPGSQKYFDIDSVGSSSSGGAPLRDTERSSTTGSHETDSDWSSYSDDTPRRGGALSHPSSDSLSDESFDARRTEDGAPDRLLRHHSQTSSTNALVDRGGSSSDSDSSLRPEDSASQGGLRRNN